MKRFASVALSAVVGCSALLGGCKPKEDGVEAIRAALPQADAVQIRVPEGSARTLGELARFYQITRGVSVDLNHGAATVLLLVRAIVAFPVTSIEGDTYVWGPWTEALSPSEYRLTVSESAPGEYTWSLEGRVKADGASAAFEAVVAGIAIPGEPLRGQGTFTMDFDVAERLDPAGNDGQGRLSVDYDLETEPRQVLMDFEKTETPPGGVPADVSFHYEYREATGGAGDFVFSEYGDLDDNESAWEHLDIRSRWQADGAGRSDVTIEGGDLGAIVVEGSECWDTAFGRVYWSDSQGWEPSEGDAAACVF
jgi:hypothetical protein